MAVVLHKIVAVGINGLKGRLDIMNVNLVIRSDSKILWIAQRDVVPRKNLGPFHKVRLLWMKMNGPVDRIRVFDIPVHIHFTVNRRSYYDFGSALPGGANRIPSVRPAAVTEVVHVERVVAYGEAVFESVNFVVHDCAIHTVIERVHLLAERQVSHVVVATQEVLDTNTLGEPQIFVDVGDHGPIIRRRISLLIQAHLFSYPLIVVVLAITPSLFRHAYERKTCEFVESRQQRDFWTIEHKNAIESQEPIVCCCWKMCAG